MTEEIINSDGSRNWEANILLDNIKRLEQENKELKEMLSKEPKAMQAFQISYSGLKRDSEILWGMVKDYKSALEEIREVLKPYLTECQGFLCEPIDEVLNKINEVIGEDTES